MKDKNRIIGFIFTATVITVYWFCLAAGVVFAKEPDKEHGVSLSDIFIDENQNLRGRAYDEEKSRSPVIPALMFLSVIFLGTAGRHYRKYYMTSKQELAEMIREFDSLISQAVIVEAGRIETDLGQIENLEQQIAITQKELHNMNLGDMT